MISNNAYDSPCLQQLEQFVPAVPACCRGEDGGRTLGSLSDSLTGYSPPPTIQKRDDLIALAEEKTGALLGAGTARVLRAALEESFTALTANHHAINTHPDFTQGTLIYALRLLTGESDNSARALPVFAAGGIPMSDFTYPPGILLGRPKKQDSTTGAHLRLFRPLARKTLVNWQPSFNAFDVADARARGQGGGWLSFEKDVLTFILDSILSAPEVLGQKLYSHQCTVINSRLWPCFFKREVSVPRLVMLDKLELERDLLIADMANESSLAYAILFDQELRALITRNLNGDRGCWTCENPDGTSLPARGSVFFWGIDREGRMLPLYLDRQGKRLVCAQYPSFQLELAPGPVARALRENTILPGLYLGFTAMALARGLLCCGGVFQTGYLRRMRGGTADCLAATGYGGMAACLRKLPDAPLTSGFLPLGFRGGNSLPYAAGGIELIAAGGLSAEDLQRMRAMTVARVLESSLDYIYELAVPSGERRPGWLEELRTGYGIELFPDAHPAVFQ